MKFNEIVKYLNVNLEDFAQVNAICLGRAFHTQSSFEANVVKKSSVQVNLKDASVMINGVNHDMQCIGSKTVDDKWVWAWAENTSNFPTTFEYADSLKQFGEKNEALYAKTPYYKEPHNHFSNCLMGFVSAYFDCCFLECNSEKGTVYLAVTNADKRVFSKVNAKQFCEITRLALTTHPVDHLLFLQGFLLFNDIPYAIENDKLVATFDKDVLITLKTINDVVRLDSLRIL